MKFLANENFILASVNLLRAAGLDVLFVAESCPSTKDEDVMKLAIREDRTILTHDRDYGELVFKQGYRPPKGIVYFRLKHYSPQQPAEILLKLLADSTFQIEGLFTVVDSDHIFRQRHY